nr:cellulose synthase A catalytic subunit 3 [UDP-forming] [Ipomoea batatas]
MDSEADTKGKSLKTLGDQVCQICGDGVGTTVDGSPAIHNEEVEDVDAHDDSENQNEKQKIAERMLSWHMTFGREETGGPKYDKEVSGELSAASPGRLSMASPGPGVGTKHIHPLTYSIDANQSPNTRVVDPVREFGSLGLGNVAWKERVDGWKMKQEKNVIPMTTSHPPSERGGGDIDASSPAQTF